nr:ribosomal protein S2 [Ostreobium quekettii]
MAITIKSMIQNGLHLGHSKQSWNPKMTPYIYMESNKNHIIDLIQTYSHLKQTLRFLANSSAKGKTILFVGTKRQSSKLISKVAKSCNSFFVTERWLGGLLTNWSTVQKSITKLNELELQEKNNSFLKLQKKEIIKITKEKERLNKYLGGLKNMKSLPDIIIIIDQKKEMNAVLECKKLGLRSITILDTNGDPSLADLFIPANDDSITSLKFILDEFLKYIKYGQKHFKRRQRVLR